MQAKKSTPISHIQNETIRLMFIKQTRDISAASGLIGLGNQYSMFIRTKDL